MKINERAHLHVAANTHPGMKGKNNEDRFAISVHRFGPKKDIPSVLAVICDGIGGHRAGEVAAEIAVETISKMVAQSDGTQPLTTLQEAILRASENIQAQAETNPERLGMGATCVCAWAIGDRLYTASVGDSRLYLIRDGAIQQITTDHTWIQEAIEYGALTPEQARGHPNAHVIRRYLGSKIPVEVDFRLRLGPDETNEQAEANQGTPILRGDRLVLCSDGLTDLVENEEIKTQVLSQDREPALQSLVDLANERGGHDNITVVILEASPSFTPTVQPLPKPEGTTARKLALPCLVSASLVAVLGLIAFGVFWAIDGWSIFRRSPTPTTSLTVLPSLQLTVQVTPKASLTASITPLPASPTATSTSILPTASVTGPQRATYTPWPTNTPLPTATTTLEPTLTETIMTVNEPQP